MAFLVKTQRGTRQGRPLLPSYVHLSRETADLPATTAESIFTVNGGWILVHLLLGEVTTVIQTQTCNLKVTVNPTTGSSGDVASNLDITTDEVGTLYYPQGDGTALVGVNAGTGFASGGLFDWIVPVGTIDIETSATNTGSIKWDLWYENLDEAAFVEVA